jgi:hypothetical protein
MSFIRTEFEDEILVFAVFKNEEGQTTFSIPASFMSGVVADIVEKQEYNTEEEAKNSIDELLLAKTNDAERIKQLAEFIQEVERQEKIVDDVIENHMNNREVIEECVVMEKHNISSVRESQQEEFNYIYHSFMRESVVVGRVMQLIGEIDFTKSGEDKIRHFEGISSDIDEEYNIYMIPKQCMCEEGHDHAGCDDMLNAVLNV